MNSGRNGPENSELSNEYRSAISSWNSSLDLDMSNGRETENSDAEAEELEESIPEGESSEFLVEDVVSEEPQEEGEQGNSQNLLHFLSEVMVRLLFPQLSFSFPLSLSFPLRFLSLSLFSHFEIRSGCLAQKPGFSFSFPRADICRAAALAHPTSYQNACYPCMFLLLLVLFTETKAWD